MTGVAREPRSKTGSRSLLPTPGLPPVLASVAVVPTASPGVRMQSVREAPVEPGPRQENRMQGPELHFTEALIDNGALGTHTVRFESGLLARQAAGSATVYLDSDTMLLAW